MPELEVAYVYTPGTPTGTPAPGKIRIVAGHLDLELLTPTRIPEALAIIGAIQAPVDHLIAMANRPEIVEKLGFKPFASFGWRFEPADD